MKTLKEVILAVDRQEMALQILRALHVAWPEETWASAEKEIFALIEKIENTIPACSDHLFLEYGAFDCFGLYKEHTKRYELISIEKLITEYQPIREWDQIATWEHQDEQLSQVQFGDLTDYDVIRLCLRKRTPKPMQIPWYDLPLWLGAAVPDSSEYQMKNAAAHFLSIYIAKKLSLIVELEEPYIPKDEIERQYSLKWDYLFGEISAYHELKRIHTLLIKSEDFTGCIL